jgi:threonine/homoserine/homoserine lactone efflux protein
MFGAVLVGFVFGFFGSMPVAGPASALVLSRGLMGRFRSGVMIGLGCSVAEGVYAFGAYWGFATFLTAYPVIEGLSHVVAACILLALGVTFARYRSAKAAASVPTAESTWKSASLGFSVTILNPALLATWTASATTLHSAGVDIEREAAWAFGVGVTVGIAAWFSLLIGLLERYRERFREEILNRVIRTIGVLIFGLGLFFVYKAIRHFTGAPEPEPAPSSSEATTTAEATTASASTVPSAPASSAPLLTQNVSVKGLSGRVPDFFVPFDPEQLARMEQNARLGDATLLVEVAGMKDPGPRAARGALTLIRTAKPLDAPRRRGTVQQHLEAQAASMRLLLELGGLKPSQWATKIVGATIEIEGSVPLTVPGGGSAKVEQRLRSWVFVAKPDLTVELDASCGPNAQENCAAILAGLVREPTEVLPLDAVLGPPREPVVAVAGFRFGSSQSEFKATCKAAGAKLEALRAGDATSDLARWEREGRLLTCSGAAQDPLQLSGGAPPNFSLAQAVFHDGRLSRLMLHTPRPLAEVKTDLAKRHPCLLEDPKTGTCFFAPAAKDAEARSFGILPIEADHAKAVVVFDSPLADGP